MAMDNKDERGRVFEFMRRMFSHMADEIDQAEKVYEFYTFPEETELTPTQLAWVRQSVVGLGGKVSED